MKVLFTSLLIVAMVVAAALYTNPPNIRCMWIDGKSQCRPI